MEVTIHNIAAAKEKFDALLPHTVICSIDGEFTGINPAPHLSCFEVDTLTERYQKVKNSAKLFEMIQFGITLWTCETYTEEVNTISHEPSSDPNGSSVSKLETKSVTKRKYIAHPFTFYLFKKDKSSVFTFQSSSMTFLRENQMDFNKVIKDGMNYCTATEEQFITDLIFNRKEKAKQTFTNKIDISTIAERNKINLEDARSKVEEWLAHTQDEILLIQNLNRFERRLFYQEVASKFEDKADFSSAKDESGRDMIRCLRTNSQQQLAKIQQENEQKLVEHLGFRIFVKSLVTRCQQGGCILVGHNCIYDVAHLYEKAIDPLPESAQEFKQKLHELFPQIADTKYMTETHPQFRKMYSTTTLDALNSSIDAGFGKSLTHISVSIHPDFQNSTSSYHDAGFDAYLTGSVFIKLSEYIANRRYASFKGIQFLDHIEEFGNKIFLMFSQRPFDIKKVDQEDETRNETILLTNFNPEIRTDQIYKSLEGVTNQLKVIFAGKDTCFVRFFHADMMPQALEHLQKTNSLECSVMTYQQAKEDGILEYLYSPPSIIASQRVPKRKQEQIVVENKTEEKKQKSTCVIL